MPLYPDLAACGIIYIHFSFHATGMHEAIEEFWEEHGLDRSEDRLLLSGYVRQRKRHAAWLRWSRSHATCCDVTFGLEARPASSLWPKAPRKVHKLREKDLRAFFEMIADSGAASGVQARFAFPSDIDLETKLPLPPRVRPVGLKLSVFHEEQNDRRVMDVTYQRTGDTWQAIIEPAGLYKIEAPVTDTFFKAPYELGCVLSSSLRQEQLGAL